jgi:hypothetical protein
MFGHQKKPNLIQQVFTSMRTELDNLQKEIIGIHVLIQKTETFDMKKVQDHESRIQDLELWRTKLHAMITETTPRGKEKLNRIGKKFIRF